jgi:hypothetical protein
MSTLLFLALGLIVVLPAIVLNLLLPGWLAAVVGLPAGAWLAWILFNAVSSPEQ